MKSQQAKFKVLSAREETNSQQSTCYLCEASLEEYVKSIPDRYAEYDIQRGIVENIFLDQLAITILRKQFIPPIVLVADSQDEVKNYSIEHDFLIVEKFKILDGLQRSFRIKSIYNALMIFIRDMDTLDYKTKTKRELSKQYKEELEQESSTVTTFWTIIQHTIENKLDKSNLALLYKDSVQWFEIWVDLNKQDQIHKMLILNAGHKQMDKKHQLELLFLNTTSNSILKKMIRAKDINPAFFYNKKRKRDLHFSHILSSILSFHEKRPISIDTKLIQGIQNNLEEKLNELAIYFEDNNLRYFLIFAKKIDDLFYKEYAEKGIEWLGRETVLNGLFAAFGSYYQEKFTNTEIKECLIEIFLKIKNNIEYFKISEFDLAKKTSIDITKVNIGNVFKFSSFNAMCLFLKDTDTSVNWDELFRNGNKVYRDCK